MKSLKRLLCLSAVVAPVLVAGTVQADTVFTTSYVFTGTDAVGGGTGIQLGSGSTGVATLTYMPAQTSFDLGGDVTNYTLGNFTFVDNDTGYQGFASDDKFTLTIMQSSPGSGSATAVDTVTGSVFDGSGGIAGVSFSTTAGNQTAKIGRATYTVHPATSGLVSQGSSSTFALTADVSTPLPKPAIAGSSLIALFGLSRIRRTKKVLPVLA